MIYLLALILFTYIDIMLADLNRILITAAHVHLNTYIYNLKTSV